MQNEKQEESGKQSSKSLQRKGLVIGVDIGVSGAMCLFDPQINRVITVSDMPVYTAGAHDRRKIDTLEIYYTLSQFVRMGATLLIIEDVHAMPNVGALASFSMGHGRGVFEGLCRGLSLPFVRIPPRAWKAHYGLLKLDKGESCNTARRLYPDAAKWVKLAKHHNRAEAILLASLPSKVYLS